MEGDLILETTFLIDLEREVSRGEVGQAHRFLEQRETARLHITFTVAGELAAGVTLEDRERWEEFVAPFHVLQSGPDVCWEYGRLDQYLRAQGMLIGANDMWIAATALANRMPVATRNARDFRRVPGLVVLTY